MHIEPAMVKDHILDNIIVSFLKLAVSTKVLGSSWKLILDSDVKNGLLHGCAGGVRNVKRKF